MPRMSILTANEKEALESPPSAPDRSAGVHKMGEEQVGFGVVVTTMSYLWLISSRRPTTAMLVLTRR